VGYLTVGGDAANLMFQVVNERYLHHRPLIFTTNKPLAAWGLVLHDPDLAEAILDRVLERGRLVELRGASYRTRHLKRAEPNRSRLHEGARISGNPGPDFPETHSWIFVGFVCSLAGTIQAVRDTQGKEWVAGIGAVTLAVLLFAVFSVVSIVSFWGAKRLALRSVRPELASLQWQLLTKAVGTVERGGIHEMYLVPGAVQPSEADKERHLLEAIRRIAQVGELMELRRRADESDVAYGRRLCNFCATYRAPAVVATARRS